MDLLAKLLKKFNAASYLDLNEEERKTFRQWEDAIAGRKLTDEDVSQFLALEKDEAEKKMIASLHGSPEELFFKMELNFIRKVQEFLNSPKREKAMAEAAINQILEQ